MNGRSNRTAANRARFLEALAATANVTHAAQAVGLYRENLYNWRREDPDFAAAWEEALQLGLSALEDRAVDFAMAGSEKLMMFLLSARKPDVYGQRQAIEFSGNVSLSLRSASLDDLRAELAQLVLPRPPLTIEADDDDTSNVVPLRGPDDGI